MIMSKSAPFMIFCFYGTAVMVIEQKGCQVESMQLSRILYQEAFHPSSLTLTRDNHIPATQSLAWKVSSLTSSRAAFNGL